MDVANMIIDESQPYVTKKLRLPKDCGKYGEPPHLSRRLARAEAAKYHPRGKDPQTGKYVPYKLDAEMGSFPWPWEAKGKESVLQEYGLGLVFYFKLLKSLGFLFAIMSAITLPSMGLYIAAKTKSTAEEIYQLYTHSERILGSKLSVGALGRRIPSCRQVCIFMYAYIHIYV
jgi:hypothetical protein